MVEGYYGFVKAWEVIALPEIKISIFEKGAKKDIKDEHCSQPLPLHPPPRCR